MSNRRDSFDSLVEDIGKLAAQSKSRNEALLSICTLLKEKVAAYDWVGFYLVDPDKRRELILGPYAGEPTTHTRIPFGKGICGQAAESEKTFVIDDVNAQDNYLSCSINVKSEIVVPIFKGSRIAGELDIDSHAPAAFDEKDAAFLEKVCHIVSKIL